MILPEAIHLLFEEIEKFPLNPRPFYEKSLSRRIKIINYHLLLAHPQFFMDPLLFFLFSSLSWPGRKGSSPIVLRQ